MAVKIKSKSLIAIAAIVFLIGSIPTAIFLINHFSKSLAVNSHMEVYDKYAEEFVREETDAIEKFGKEIRIIAAERICTFEKTASKHDTIDSVEEFDARIEQIKVKVEVGRNNYCIVIFEKNSTNELEIIDWYWEE